MKALSLDELRELVQVNTKKESFSFSELPSGIPKGAITAISGNGKTEFILRFLAEHPEYQIAWIEENFSVFPFGFLQRNIKLSRVLFIDAKGELAWSTLQVLKSQIFQVVLMYVDHCEDNTLRRIQLATEKADASVIWLTSQSQVCWAVSLHLHVQKEHAEMKPHILRKRF